MNAQKTAPTLLVNIPTPRAVPAECCPSCGYDPCILWDGHHIMGGNWALRIDYAGQLCASCAESHALFRVGFMQIVWAQ